MFVFLSIIILIFTLAYIWNWRCHNYWASRGISSPPAMPFVGHLHRMFGPRWEYIDQVYKKYSSKGMWGVYEVFNPVLFVTDPEIVRDITIKDWEHFVDRRPFPFSGQEEYLNEMLFAIEGHRWKSLRSLMTPTFSSGKMKAMFPLVMDNSDKLIDETESQLKNQDFVDIYPLISYYLLDAIASCAFGIDAQCMKNKEKSHFVKSSRSIFKVEGFGNLSMAVMLTMPKLYEKLGLTIGEMDFTFLSEVVDKTIESRKNAEGKRGDALDNLLDLMKENESMTMKTLKAQCFLFVATGFDTTGGSLAMALYLIARKPEVQKTLRVELTKILDEGKEFDYQNVMEAPYLDAVVTEALRLYPSAHFIERKCTKSCKIPSNGLEIPQDMVVNIPLYSLHRDPLYWVDPLEFKPERFLKKNKDQLKPYTYLPFGLGPRNCIGMRFAIMAMKIGLAKMVYNFDIGVKPGFELELEGFVDSLRPTTNNGIQLELKLKTT